MFKTKPLAAFIEQPDHSFRECIEEPMEITGGEQPYVVMTMEYLRRLLADSNLADHLDGILERLERTGGVSEQEIMGVLNSDEEV